MDDAVLETLQRPHAKSAASSSPSAERRGASTTNVGDAMPRTGPLQSQISGVASPASATQQVEGGQALSTVATHTGNVSRQGTTRAAEASEADATSQAATSQAATSQAASEVAELDVTELDGGQEPDADGVNHGLDYE